MTRRTPKPGDSYSKGDTTWRIVSVHGDTVVFAPSWGPAVPISLAAFHRAIAIATWGSV